MHGKASTKHSQLANRAVNRSHHRMSLKSSTGKISFRLPKPLHEHTQDTADTPGDRSLAAQPAATPRTVVTCFDYSEDAVTFTEVTDIHDFVSKHRPEGTTVRWIDVDGLGDMQVIHALAEKYELHPLAIEDLLHPGTRPKIESYPGTAEHSSRLFILARMIYLVEKQLHCEQICFFLGKSTLITFQASPGDVWDSVRARIRREGSRIRKNDVSFLLYALIDAVVDQCFPVLEYYSDKLEDIEQEVLECPDTRVIKRIHTIKHELLLLRREFWPMREMVHSLQRADHANFSETASLFLRDVYDHAVQVIDLMETYREVAIGLTETYMNAMSNRMNEIMKVLTIIATIFMPLSFVAGVFGMNFQHMPEIEASWAYPWCYPIGFYALCLGIAGGMFVWFRRRHWL